MKQLTSLAILLTFLQICNCETIQSPPIITVANETFIEISKIFSKIDADFKKLEKVLTGGYGEDPFEPPEECTVTKDDLHDLKTTIDDTLNGINATKGLNCDYDPNINSELNCIELIKLTKCGMNHIQDGFLSLNNSGSYSDYKELQEAFDKLQEEYQKDLDAVVNQVSQEYQIIIEDLKTQIEVLNLALKLAIAKIFDLQVENAATKIQHGDYPGAFQTWREMNDNEALTPIIERAYNLCTNNGTNDNTANVIEFLYTIRILKTEFFNGYTTLTKCLTDIRRVYTDPITMLLVFGLNETGYYTDYSTRRTDTIRIWSTIIQMNRDADVNRCIQLSTDHASPFFKDKLIEGIVSNVYSGQSSSSGTYFETMCSFLNRLVSTLKDQGYNAMIDRMLSVSDWSNYNSIRLGIYIRRNAPNVRSRLPKTIDNIVYECNSCGLKSFKYNEYLYSPTNTIDKRRRYVFSWTPGDRVMQAEWEIRLVKDNGPDGVPYFTLQSLYRNEHAMLDENFYKHKIIGTWRRRFLTWRSTPLSETWFYWTFTPSADGQSTAITNVYYDESMYADGTDVLFNKERRMIFTLNIKPTPYNDIQLINSHSVTYQAGHFQFV